MNWLWAAITTTIIYMVVLVEGLGIDKIKTFLKTGDLNAVGDFLAGTFAPLAFIWLVAAVLTQRQELTEARKQFEENGEQFKKNQKVIDEQLRLVDQQNKNAEQQAVRSYKLDLFEYRFEIFKEVDAIARIMVPSRILDDGDVYADKISVLAQRSIFLFDVRMSERLSSIAGKLRDIRAKRMSLYSRVARPPYVPGVKRDLKDGVDSEVFATDEEELKRMVDEVLNDMSFANRTNLFSKYLNVTDAMNTLIVSASGKKRNEDDMSGLYKEWRND